ncbi:MAG TPA: hypothetical protein VD886_17520 [Herpetosiphonaceae bacterium]|nr:hypothetical protein [Herpetosiphonaceae bacterium]
MAEPRREQDHPHMARESRQVYAGIYLSRVQGIVYALSGLWPVFHLRSFERVTGPKADGWLVKTVGLLLAVIGGVLWRASVRSTTTSDLALVGAGSAAALATIDVVYASQGRISRIYLLDALMQAGFVAGWALWLRGRSAQDAGN